MGVLWWVGLSKWMWGVCVLRQMWDGCVKMAVGWVYYGGCGVGMLGGCGMGALNGGWVC